MTVKIQIHWICLALSTYKYDGRFNEKKKNTYVTSIKNIRWKKYHIKKMCNAILAEFAVTTNQRKFVSAKMPTLWKTRNIVSANISRNTVFKLKTPFLRILIIFSNNIYIFWYIWLVILVNFNFRCWWV
jgi:hypothetical protein